MCSKDVHTWDRTLLTYLLTHAGKRCGEGAAAVVAVMVVVVTATVARTRAEAERVRAVAAAWARVQGGNGDGSETAAKGWAARVTAAAAARELLTY